MSEVVRMRKCEECGSYEDMVFLPCLVLRLLEKCSMSEL